MKKAAAKTTPRTSLALGMLLWTGGMWLLMLASTPFFLVDSIAMIDVPDRGFLGEGEIWNPPLATWASETFGTDVPFWLGAIVIACLLALAAKRQCSAGLPWIVILVGAFGLTHVEMRSTMATIVLIGLTG